MIWTCVNIFYHLSFNRECKWMQYDMKYWQQHCIDWARRFHASQTHSDADTRRAWSSPLDDPRASQLSTFSEANNQGEQGSSVWNTDQIHPYIYVNLGQHCLVTPSSFNGNASICSTSTTVRGAPYRCLCDQKLAMLTQHQHLAKLSSSWISRCPSGQVASLRNDTWPAISCHSGFRGHGVQLKRRAFWTSKLLMELDHSLHPLQVDFRWIWEMTVIYCRDQVISWISCEVWAESKEMVSFNDNHPRRASPDSIDIRKETFIWRKSTSRCRVNNYKMI